MASKFSNLLTWLGAIGTVFGILAAFRIDIPEIFGRLAKMNGLTVFLTISVLALLLGLVMKWEEKKVTPGNIKGKLRDWLDAFQLPAQRITPAHAHFGWQVTLATRLNVWLLRTEAHDRYITLLSSISPPQNQLDVFNQLNDAAREQFWRTLILETSRSKIYFRPRVQNNIQQLLIERMVPITPELSEADVMQALREMDFSAAFLFNLIGLFLEVPVAPPSPTDTEMPPASRPELKQPSSTGDTEASPPEPT
jgi:hypothetical protein